MYIYSPTLLRTGGVRWHFFVFHYVYIPALSVHTHDWLVSAILLVVVLLSYFHFSLGLASLRSYSSTS